MDGKMDRLFFLVGSLQLPLEGRGGAQKAMYNYDFERKLTSITIYTEIFVPLKNSPNFIRMRNCQHI